MCPETAESRPETEEFDSDIERDSSFGSIDVSQFPRRSRYPDTHLKPRMMVQKETAD